MVSNVRIRPKGSQWYVDIEETEVIKYFFFFKKYIKVWAPYYVEDSFEEALEDVKELYTNTCTILTARAADLI